MSWEPTALYRFYAADGELLYVGITKSLPTRLGQHEADKPWFRYVTDIKVEHCRSRYSARMAELKAIREESPAWNIADRAEDDPPRPLTVQERLPERTPGLHYGIGVTEIVRALEPAEGVAFHEGTHRTQLLKVLAENGLYEEVA